MTPETRYARSGDVNIAYTVVGDGPIDLVYIQGFVSHVELAWRVPAYAEFLNGLASFSRFIFLDKRGTGMSDPVQGAPSLETRMDDVRAVMDAAGSSRAAIMGVSEGTPMSILFAATYPERVSALVLQAGAPRFIWAPDYPFGQSVADHDREVREILDEWGTPEFFEEAVAFMAPSYDDENRRAFAEYIRLAASPGAAAALERLNGDIDVRHVLPAVRAPTLILNLKGDSEMIVEGCRYMAERIPGARLVQIEGEGHIPGPGSIEPFVGEIERFLRTVVSDRAPEVPDRQLATLLFTDIVDSTTHMARLGDAGWRQLIERHHELVRAELARARGREIDTAGDGFFAAFDGPARAVRCAQAIANDVQELGIAVRSGLHTGECELVDGKVTGIAVHTGARVAAHAGPGEVLVSSTVKDLVAGSGLEFRDRGVHELKGIPGEWRLYAAV
jgi:class 3 adenylate cyclase/alpha-beta hydrolase superfamily lysophospholipase